MIKQNLDHSCFKKMSSTNFKNLKDLSLMKVKFSKLPKQHNLHQVPIQNLILKNIKTVH